MLFDVGQILLFFTHNFLSKPHRPPLETRPLGSWPTSAPTAHVNGTFPPRNAIHSQIVHDLLSLRNAVVHGQFSWNDKTRQIVRSPDDKPITKVMSRRKLQALLDFEDPSFQDRVVQEVLLMILEPVFEARFSPKSHAFRPNRNAHMVIRTIRSNFAGYLRFLRGDLSEIFDNVERNVVMGCLEKAVKDKKILGLIKSALKGRVRSGCRELLMWNWKGSRRRREGLQRKGFCARMS